MTLRWSSQLSITPLTSNTSSSRLPGDKLTLPPRVLEELLAVAPISEVAPTQTQPSSQLQSQGLTQLQDSFDNRQRQQQLPHPLTFRVVNPRNGRAVYAGIREFSAEEGSVSLSGFLRDALGLSSHPEAETEPETVTVHAHQLPKGSYVRLRPLEAGYDEDWKALLERYLRENFTTLTTGEVLTVTAGGSRRSSEFRFLVDRVEPEGDGICVVDTDLEVDIVALNEEQARETLKRRLEKATRSAGSGGSSMGGVLKLGETVSGQAVAGDYVDYEVRDWGRVDIVVEVDADEQVGLFVSPLAARQRNRPRDDEHVFGDLSSRSSKRITIASTNVELDGAEALYVSVHAPDDGQAVPYKLRVVGSTDVNVNVNVNGEEGNAEDEEREEGSIQCKNCRQWVPQRTLVLHENFCLRNNILCTACDKVFHKRSAEWQNHWHCSHADGAHGNSIVSHEHHDRIFHTSHACAACDFNAPGLPGLAHHRTTTCPAKPILCQFCHLVVPQQADGEPDLHDAEVLLSGLTPHELVDGGRTTECHLCNKIVRLRDMTTHLRHHDLNRLSRPVPRICLNQNCGRTVDSRADTSLGLCPICYGPLYVDTYDPEGKALRRRIERRYLSQMMTGCGKPWCRNKYCKTSNPDEVKSVSPVTATRGLVDAVFTTTTTTTPNTAPFYFCTDQTGQQRRGIAEMLAAQPTSQTGKSYEMPWCVAAVEATGDLDAAREWLGQWAVAREEARNGNS